MKDIAASVHQKLLNKARQTGRIFNELLQYFAMERFLYRLAKSEYADRFVLKGALGLVAWSAPTTRPTRDIDLLGRVENSPENIQSIFATICSQQVEPDGIRFDPSSVETRRISEDADYHGIRVSFSGRLGNARLSMQVDIGFSDVVTPSPKQIDYPTVLDMPAPSLKTYSRETAVAEKFEAMVKLGTLNSRMKDFFDICLLSDQFEFEGPLLARAVSRTFDRRETKLTAEPECFRSHFAEDDNKQAQWSAFLKRLQATFVPSDFQDVVNRIRTFLQPVLDALTTDKPFDRHWPPGGPWG